MQLSSPKIDLTISITTILAICAIIAPILTAIINNLYQIKIRKIELKYESHKSTTLHNRDIFEHYLSATGRYLYYDDAQSEISYGEAYFSALQLVPKNIRNQMVSINSHIIDGNIPEAIKELEIIAPILHSLL